MKILKEFSSVNPHNSSILNHNYPQSVTLFPPVILRSWHTCRLSLLNIILYIVEGCGMFNHGTFWDPVSQRIGLLWLCKIVGQVCWLPPFVSLSMLIPLQNCFLWFWKFILQKLCVITCSTVFLNFHKIFHLFEIAAFHFARLFISCFC